MKKMSLSKLEAAKCEMCSAIFLFFNYQDMVSIHLLVSAAHEICDALSKKSGAISFRGLLDDKISIKSDRKKVRDLLNKAYNSIKHARRDEVVELNVDHTELLLFLCIIQYWQLNKSKLPWDMMLYVSWYSQEHGSLVRSVFQGWPKMINVLSTVDFKGYSRSELYKDFIGLSGGYNLSDGESD